MCSAALQYRCRKGTRLTWTLLDTEGSVGVLGSGVVLQLKGCGIVHKRLRALGHTGAAVVEIGASLRNTNTVSSEDTSETSTTSRAARRLEGRDSSHRESITAAFHFYAGSGHANQRRRLFELQMGEKLEPLIRSRDVNGELFSHKPLKCFAVCGHGAETAVIELDEPFYELQLQYHPSKTATAVRELGKQEEEVDKECVWGGVGGVD